MRKKKGTKKPQQKKEKKQKKSKKVKPQIPSSTSGFKIQLLEKTVVKSKGKQKRRSKFQYEEIPITHFRKDREYRIFLTHKESGQRRLLGFGRFKNIPVFSTHPDSKGREIGGRWFRPNKTKPKKQGSWILVENIIAKIEKEMEEISKDLKVDIMGVMIPPKNYFHSKWMIYSDRPLKGNTRWKKFGINCVIEYVYTNAQFIGKRTIVIDALEKGIMIKNLHKYTSDWEFEIETKLDILKQDRRGQVSLVAINGYVPLAY